MSECPHVECVFLQESCGAGSVGQSRGAALLFLVKLYFQLRCPWRSVCLPCTLTFLPAEAQIGVTKWKQQPLHGPQGTQAK